MKNIFLALFLVFGHVCLFSNDDSLGELIENSQTAEDCFSEKSDILNITEDLINHGVFFFHSDMVLLQYDLVNSCNHKEMHYDKTTSTYFDFNGDFSRGGIFFVNGIANDEAQVRSHLKYLSQFTNDEEVIGICNISNGWYDDLQGLGYGKAGIITSPVLSILISWMNFFDQNKKDPLLHICHSQGSTHTKNALIRAPKEWRDRIIIVNIAGGSFFSEDMCYKAINYVARLDIIPFFTEERWYIEQPTNLIILDGGLLDHDFQSSTYSGILSENISNYLKNIHR